MKTSQSARFKKRVSAQKRNLPLTKKEKRVARTKKWVAVIGMLSLGIIVGITVGVNTERSNTMTEYSGEAYNAGKLESDKVWWESVVKNTASNPTNLDNVKLPAGGVVLRPETGGSLYCLSVLIPDYDRLVEYPHENKCSVVSGTGLFNVGELEKVIPPGGMLINNGGGSWDCGASKTLFSDKPLKDCLTFLREDMIKQYNLFVSTAYTNEEEKGLYISDIGSPQ